MSKRGEESWIQAEIINNPQPRSGKRETEKRPYWRGKQSNVGIVSNQGCNAQIHKPKMDSGPGHVELTSGYSMGKQELQAMENIENRAIDRTIHPFMIIINSLEPMEPSWSVQSNKILRTNERSRMVPLGNRSLQMKTARDE